MPGQTSGHGDLGSAFDRFGPERDLLGGTYGWLPFVECPGAGAAARTLPPDFSGCPEILYSHIVLTRTPSCGYRSPYPGAFMAFSVAKMAL